jgi:PAT family beta-lactamase induction signal transducer AmpG
MFKTKKYFVVGTQMLSGLAFGMLALSLPLPSFFGYAIALMGIVALSGATHDIAGDGVYLSELSLRQQAEYIGWQGAFYNLAKILANGGLVFLAGMLKDSIGILHAWMFIMALCGVLMLALSLYHSRMLPTGGSAAETLGSVREGLRSLREIIATFFTKKHVIWYITFIILYRFAEGFAIKIVPLFLKASVADGGLGLSIRDIGLIYGSCGTAAFIAGSIIAGYYISARGLKQTLMSLCCAFNIPFAVYLLLALFQPSNLPIIGTAIVFEYFGYGFGFVGLTLFMMQQVAPGHHKMAHYAFATGVMNLGVMLPGMLSGYLSTWIGYQNFFIFVLFATVPAFLATWFVRRKFSSINN